MNSAHIPKDKQDKLMIDAVNEFKAALASAWHQGYATAKEELVEEAKAIVKIDKELAAINKIKLST